MTRLQDLPDIASQRAKGGRAMDAGILDSLVFIQRGLVPGSLTLAALRRHWCVTAGHIHRRMKAVQNAGMIKVTREEGYGYILAPRQALPVSRQLDAAVALLQAHGYSVTLRQRMKPLQD